MAKAKVTEVINTIELPRMKRVEESFPYHLNLQLDAKVSAALAALAESLLKERMLLRNGQAVTNRRQAAMWLLEQLPG